MRKTTLAFLSLSLALVAGSAQSETVRYPSAGGPALSIDAPKGWTHKPLDPARKLEALVLTSPAHVEVAIIILPHVGSPEDYAKQMSEFSHLEMRNAGPAELLGRHGFMFDSAFPNGGAMFDIHVVQVPLDPLHLLLVRLQSPKGASSSQIDEGRRVVKSIKLVR